MSNVFKMKDEAGDKIGIEVSLDYVCVRFTEDGIGDAAMNLSAAGIRRFRKLLKKALREIEPAVSDELSSVLNRGGCS